MDMKTVDDRRGVRGWCRRRDAGGGLWKGKAKKKIRRWANQSFLTSIKGRPERRSMGPGARSYDEEDD